MRAVGNFILIPSLVVLLGVLPARSQIAPAPLPTKPDELEARASQGDLKAQVALGYASYLAKHYEKAARWFFTAVGQGKTDADSAYAYFALGVLFRQGFGVPQDSARAYVFLRVGALLGSQDAKTSLDAVANALTPSQLAEAQAELLELFRASALKQGRVLSDAEQAALLDPSKPEDAGGPASPSFKFAKNQRVYVVAVEANSASLDAAKPDLGLERLAKDQFKKHKFFRIANALSDSDFVFLVVLDSTPGTPIEEIAFAVSLNNYDRARVSLDALRNSALWQGENHLKVGRIVASIGWSEILHRQNVVAGLVTQFHRDALAK